MAHGITYPARTNLNRAESISVCWYPNGSTDPVTVIGGGVASVAWTATGSYRIYLNSKRRRILGAHHTATVAAGTDYMFVNTLLSDAYRGNTTASSYVAVKCTANGTAVDIAAGTGSMILSTIVVSDANEYG